MRSLSPSNPAPAAAPIDRTFLALPLWQTFSFRLTVLFGSAFLLVVAVVGVFAYRSLERTEMAGFQRRLHSLANAISHLIDGDRVAALAADPAQPSPWLDSLATQLKTVIARESDIESIYIMLPTDEPTQLRFLLDASKLSRVAERGELYDASTVPYMLRGFSDVVVEHRPFGDEFGVTQSGYAPVRDSDGRAVAVVGVDVLAVRVQAVRARVLLFCILLFGGAAALVLLLSLIVSQSIRRPLSRVVHAASAIARGDLDTHLHLARRDEFGVLARQFDTMAAHLRDRERLRETFGLYISRDLAASLLKENRVPALGGAEYVATIVFIDLADYTRISEYAAPVEIVEMLNAYLTRMVEVIESHRGCVVDFMGDAIMAIFGAPFYHPDHAHDAVRCALAMREALAALNAEWEAGGLARRWRDAGIAKVEARMGLHTGSMVAGNIGSTSRMKYSVIGDAVNIAARLEGVNKELGTTILLSEDVKLRVPLDLSATFHDHGPVDLRGRNQNIRVYSV